MKITPRGTLSPPAAKTPLTVYTISPNGGVSKPASIANIPNIAKAYGFISGPIKCIKSGVNVIQTDLDAGLSQFKNNTFDYVIMTQTLQAIYYPEKLLTEMIANILEAI